MSWGLEDELGKQDEDDYDLDSESGFHDSLGLGTAAS
jgi:hypothetical protein